MNAQAAAQIESKRFLTFRIDQQMYGLPSDIVVEVIRVPALARIPQSPGALLGLANLRGSVLPLVGLREMLGKPSVAALADARAIVLNVGSPVALVVDSVANLESVSSQQIETKQTEIGKEGTEKLLGAFSIDSGKHVAKILDVKALLQAAFSSLSRIKQKQLGGAAVAQPLAVAHAFKNREMLVTFEVAQQEFALPLRVVKEILTLPPTLTAVARPEAVLLGITSVRDALVPILSMRGLLGLGAGIASHEFEKIIVMKIGDTQVGLVADQARAIVAADPELMDPVPPVIAARTGAESRIRSIYRGDGGRRLISVLSPEHMFREEVMRKLTAGHRAVEASHSQSAAPGRDELIVLVFRLGEDEFGLPIEAVVEVAQVPPQITRIPKTPKFLEGVVNLRGEVLPVVDQRRRFDLPKLENVAARKLIVVKTERHRAGLIVDAVSDVLRSERAALAPPPELSDERTSRLVRGVINLENMNRIVLLLDPAELLTRAEQGLLDNFQAQSKKADA